MSRCRVFMQIDFVRHPRARRYIIRVLETGSVRVTIPRWGSKREAQAFAESQGAWVVRQIGRIEHERAEQAARDAQGAALSDQDSRELWARARVILPARLMDLAAVHELSVAKVSVRNQRWRWGSCSRKGHICLNWRLIQMPDWVRDYVMIHELMHLRRMDHSASFWKLVAAACPEYLEARAWLRAAGRRHHLALLAS